MATKIAMPKLGLTMSSGSVREWKKNVGETVKKGEILFCVATDKLTVDVESQADGVLLATVVEIGKDVPIGEIIGYIGASGEKIALPPSASPPPPSKREAFEERKAPLSEGGQSPQATGGSSPKAKKIARENGIDINSLNGTGPNGWVVAKDVLNALDSTKTKSSPVAAKMAQELGLNLAEISTGPRIMKADVAAKKTVGGTRRIPITAMRRIIGERMLQSVTNAPAVSYFVDADMTELNKMRVICNKALEKKGIKISFNDIFMKLCAKLLMENPMANAYVEPEAFVLHDFVNIGFAAAIPNGLLVPNIKNVESKSLAEIAQERAVLVEKARSGTLSMDEMSGGTFTISNLGMMGVTSFTPIINPPEAAILGIGTTTDRPVVLDGQIVIRPLSTLCLTADHRLVDGADGAKIISDLKMLAENPALFML